MGKWDGKRRHTMECVFCDVVLKLTRFTVRDFVEFRQWVIEKKKEAFKKESADYAAFLTSCGITDPMVLIEKIDAKLNTVDITEEAGTVEGLAQIAYLAARYHHPDIKPSEVMDLIEVNNANINAIMEAALPPEFLGRAASNADGGDEPEKKTEASSLST